MIIVYTSAGCASCRKAKAWLKEKNINYVEKNIFTDLLKEEEIKYIMSRCDNGIDDIVSKRSKVIMEGKIDVDEMSISQLIAFIKENPTVLKRPIIISEKNMLVGYDEEEIDVFKAEIMKQNFTISCIGDECPNYKKCCKLDEASLKK